MVMELLRSLEFPPPPGPLGAEDDGCPGRTWGGQCDERVGSELAECSEPSVSQEYGMRWSRWCESSGWAKDVFVGLVGCGMTRLSGPSRWICTWLILRRDESTLTGADAVIGCGPTVETNVCPLPPLAAAADVPAAPTTLLSALSATVCAVPPPDSAENTGFAGHAHVTLVVEPIVNAGPTHVNLFWSGSPIGRLPMLESRPNSCTLNVLAPAYIRCTNWLYEYVDYSVILSTADSSQPVTRIYSLL